MFGAALQFLQAVAQWREVQKRRNVLYFRRYQRLFGVGDGGKNSLFYLLVALLDLVALRLPELVQLIDVFLDGVGEVGEVVGQQVRIGQAHHNSADGFRQRAAVAEIRVGEMRVPVKIVVDGVVNAATVLAAISQVQRRDAEMIQERGVIRARTERSDAQIGTFANLVAIRGSGVGDALQAQPLECRVVLFRIGDILGDTVDEFFERMRAAHL